MAKFASIFHPSEAWCTFYKLVINCNAAVQCLLATTIWEKGEWLFLVRIFIASFFVDILFLARVYWIVFPLCFVVNHLLFVFCFKIKTGNYIFILFVYILLILVYILYCIPSLMSLQQEIEGETEEGGRHLCVHIPKLFLSNITFYPVSPFLGSIFSRPVFQVFSLTYLKKGESVIRASERQEHKI